MMRSARNKLLPLSEITSSSGPLEFFMLPEGTKKT